MKRIFVVMVAAWLVASCGGKSDESAKQETPAAEQKRGVQMIPDEEFTEFEKLAGAHIRPYFDAGATQTEKTVKAGEPFDLYVFAEYSTQYPMSAAEYRLVLPQGMSVVSSANSDSTILTMGRFDEDFMMAFRCATGPKLWLVRYSCVADDKARGGTIEIQKGANLNFLGFTMCDEQKTLIKAKPGTATLKVD